MGEEDRNPDIIRKVNRELSNVRKEQRIIRLWGGVLLMANLVLLGGSLWVLGLRMKQPVPVETAFEYPVPATPVTPAEEENIAGIADNVSEEMSNLDNMDGTEEMDETNETSNMDSMEEAPLETESSLPPVPVPVAVSPVTTRPVTTRPVVARTAKTTGRPRRNKKVATIPAQIITRPGMTLRSLARRYYGSEVFWVYLYDRNMRVLSSLDSSSPDILLSGIQLELPRPADYGIDATEPLSLQRACQQAKSLEKQ